jgi:hypothetical protein
MRLVTLCAVSLLALAAGVAAQPPFPLDLQIVFTGSDVTSVNGTTTDQAEFDGVAVASSEAQVYLFDSTFTYDGLFQYTGTLPPTVFATEAQLAGASASAGDLDADDTNLYTSIFDGSRQRIWRIPHTGFGGAVEMVDSTVSANLDEIEVDRANNRLLLTYSDTFGAPPAPFTEDIVTVPLNATNATPTVIATEAALEVALATIPGYADDTSDDINVFDFTVQSDGDIIASHGFSSNRQINGSLLKITSTGTVSVFRTADQIITAAGANPATVDIGSVNVEALSDDQILIDVRFSSDIAQLDQFVAVVSADGTSQKMLATDAQLTSDPDVTTSLVPSGQTLAHSFAPNSSSMDGKGGDVAGNDDYYFYRQGASAGTAPENAVLRLTGIHDFLNPTITAVPNWNLFR